MDDPYKQEVADLMRSIRDARASDVAFLESVSKALRIATGKRDWGMVVRIQQTVSGMANDLAEIYSPAS